MKKTVKLIVQYLILLAVILLGAQLYKQLQADPRWHYDIIAFLAIHTVLRIAVFLLVLFRTKACILHADRTCVPVYAVCAAVTIGLLIAQYFMLWFYPTVSTGLLLLAAVGEIFNAVTAGRSKKPEE